MFIAFVNHDVGFIEGIFTSHCSRLKLQDTKYGQPLMLCSRGFFCQILAIFGLFGC